MSKLTYTESTIHGPEVDFGTGWKVRDFDGPVTARVTWVAYMDPATGFSERGDVIAFGPGNARMQVLGRDIPLFVVEHVLTGSRDDNDADWADACLKGSDVEWVTRRLARFNGCEIVRYAGKERYQGEVKAARAYAAAWGLEARSGGWIYNRHGEPMVQGWRSYAAHLRQTRRIVPIRQETTGTDHRDRRFSETWAVSTSQSF